MFDPDAENEGIEVYSIGIRVMRTSLNMVVHR